MESAGKIAEQIISVARLLDRAGDLILSEFEISMGAFEIMALIQEGFVTTGDLAKRTGSSPSNITHMTKVLEAKGYIVRSIDGQDKRVWRFLIAKDGTAPLQAMQSLYSEAAGLLFSQFPDQKQQDVSDFLKAIQVHLEIVFVNKKEVLDLVRVIKNREQGHGI